MTQAILRIGVRGACLVTYEAVHRSSDEVGISIQRVRMFGSDFTAAPTPIRLSPREREEVVAVLGSFELGIKGRESAAP